MILTARNLRTALVSFLHLHVLYPSQMMWRAQCENWANQTLTSATCHGIISPTKGTTRSRSPTTRTVKTFDCKVWYANREHTPDDHAVDNNTAAKAEENFTVTVRVDYATVQIVEPAHLRIT